MDEDRSLLHKRILGLTVEIIYLLTGEVYGPVKKCGKKVPSSHLFVQKRSDDEKILDLTNKILHLLTGEVPIRYEDIMVCFSLEEWEFVEGHQDLYQDIILENQQPLASLGLSSNRNKLEKRLRPIQPKDTKGRNKNALQDYQDDDLFHIKVEATEETEEGQGICKENNSLNGHNDYNIFEDLPVYQDWGVDPPSENGIAPNALLSLHYPDEVFHLPERGPCFPKSSDMVTHRGNLFPCPGPRHQRIHTGQKTFPQSEYDNFVSRECIFDAYPSIHTEEKPYLCSECGGCFTLKSYTGDKPFVCRDCKKSLMIRLSGRPAYGPRAPNKIAKRDRKPFPCSKCNKYFTRKWDLTRHLRTHTGEKPFRCSECGKCFTLKSNLGIHVRIHTGEKPFACLICNKRFTQKTELVLHQRSHSGEKPFQCSQCGKHYAQKAELTRHERTHTGEKPFHCSECGKCFALKSYLATHVRIHTGEKPFICLICNKRFTQKPELVLHQKSHSGEKPFQCFQCEKCFVRKTDLTRHERTHTGEKPFRCSECGKCFALKSYLVSHVRIHTGEKPFVCLDCNKCFTQKTVLVRHRRVHTGEKPFHCSDCGKTYAWKCLLENHQRMIHTRAKS